MPTAARKITLRFLAAPMRDTPATSAWAGARVD